MDDLEQLCGCNFRAAYIESSFAEGVTQFSSYCAWVQGNACDLFVPSSKLNSGRFNDLIQCRFRSTVTISAAQAVVANAADFGGNEGNAYLTRFRQ